MKNENWEYFPWLDMGHCKTPCGTIAWDEVGWGSGCAISMYPNILKNANIYTQIYTIYTNIREMLAAILREKRFGENLWLRHLAQCKMQNVRCKLQSSKYEMSCCNIVWKEVWWEFGLRHLAQLPFHLHSSCLSCSCTTVSLMLDVQASFFATSVENPSNQKKLTY